MSQGDHQRRQSARLIAAQRSVALATADAHGVPAISYVPFAPVAGAFAIVVSRLAAHTEHLMALRPAAVLLIDDVEQPDAYARVRLAVSVRVRPHAPDSSEAAAIWAALEARHGPTVAVLRTLPDFVAVSLEPLDARLILGFASAHDVAASTIIELLREGGAA